MAGRDVVLVGASAGGVETLQTLVRGLPADLPATVLIVLHVSPAGGGALVDILDRCGPLPVRTASDGQPLRRGEVLVAAPDRHLLLEHDRVRLGAGPPENGHRPAVDALFRSAAEAVGERAVGVVLSGFLDDGAAGLAAVRAQGGLGIVQDPADALYDGMPSAAIEAAAPDHVVPVADIPPLLSSLLGSPVPDEAPAREAAEPGSPTGAVDAQDAAGAPSGYTCPDCSGVLWRIEDDRMVRFRCRVGHAWSPESLHAEQSAGYEGALWTALRAIEERAALAREMGERARAGCRPSSAATFHDQEAETTAAAGTLRKLLSSRVLRGPDEPVSGSERPEDDETSE